MINKIKKLINSTHKSFVAKQNKFVFTHVPKCAGSALSQSLLKGLYSSIISNSPLTTGIDIRAANKISSAIGLDEQRVREVQLASFLESQKKVFITGHCYANPSLVSEYCNDWNFITVLRDPVDRFVSEYVYNTFKTEKWKNNSLPFEEYIEEEESYFSSITYARFFSGMTTREIFDSPTEAIERSVNNLNNFYKVGFLNNLNDWVAELNREFNGTIEINRTNKSPNTTVSQEIISSASNMKLVKKLCKIDIDIYTGINDRIKSEKNQLK